MEESWLYEAWGKMPLNMKLLDEYLGAQLLKR